MSDFVAGSAIALARTDTERVLSLPQVALARLLAHARTLSECCPYRRWCVSRLARARRRPFAPPVLWGSCHAMASGARITSLHAVTSTRRLATEETSEIFADEKGSWARPQSQNRALHCSPPFQRPSNPSSVAGRRSSTRHATPCVAVDHPGWPASFQGTNTSFKREPCACI